MVADDGEHRIGRDEAADGEGHGAEAEKRGRQRTKITDKSHVGTLADGDEPAKACRDCDRRHGLHQRQAAVGYGSSAAP